MAAVAAEPYTHLPGKIKKPAPTLTPSGKSLALAFMARAVVGIDHKSLLASPAVHPQSMRLSI